MSAEPGRFRLGPERADARSARTGRGSRVCRAHRRRRRVESREPFGQFGTRVMPGPPPSPWRGPSWHLVRVLFPVAAIEQFERNVARVAGLSQRCEDLLERRDPIAGINAIGVDDLVAGDLRVVVDVEDADRGFPKEVRAPRSRSRPCRGDTHPAGSSPSCRHTPRRYRAPRRAAGASSRTPRSRRPALHPSIADIQERAVAIRGGEEIDHRLRELRIVALARAAERPTGARARRGLPISAAHPISRFACSSPLPPGLILDDPLREADHIGHRGRLLDPFAEVLQQRPSSRTRRSRTSTARWRRTRPWRRCR